MRLRHLLVVLVLLVTPSALWAQAVSLLAPGIYRLDRDADAAAAALPSLSFEDAARRERLGRATDGPSVKPRFSTDDSGRQVVEINVAPGTDLYGTGMVAGPLLRTGRRTVAWNTDAYNYTEAFDSLYQSHPWVLAVRADGSAYGVLADTTYRCVIDLRDGIRFVADGPSHPVIIFEGRSPQQVIERLTDMIGRMPLPPKWTLGYHQCRYSYFPDRRAQEVASEFRKRDIPCDVIWHDIHYMHNNLNFTFDPEHFPDPAAHNAALHAMDFKTVWMINTGQGIRDENPVAKEMRERSLSVETASGEPFIGRVWPGDCLFPDFTRAEVRAWWGGLFRDFLAVGVDGVWNDMNEPAVFEGEGWTMPLDNIHRADENLGGTATHARYHNVYGMLMARSTREGILRARPDRRPFVLTRANFIGGHRYAAMWTGDNAATWEHVDWSITMALNLGLSGQPFAGPDIGGFKGSISGEMFARWMGIGAMLPFARGHTEVDSIDKEPWAFGPEVERTSRLALERRYQLMPYFYTLFHESSRNGMPVIRPLFFADPADASLREVDDDFLLGDGLLISTSPVEDADAVAVLPSGIWRPLRLQGHTDPVLPRTYIRGGAIVPTGPVMEFVDEHPLDPVTLLVCLDDKGRASGTLYEDAGDGFDYRRGQFLLTRYQASRRGNVVTITIAQEDGRMPRPDREVVVRVILDGQEIVASGRDGAPIRLRLP